MKHLYYRAGAFGYFVLVGPWIVMGLLCYPRLYTHQGYEWAIVGCIIWGFSFIIWLRGFLVRISQDELKYRSGCYKTTIISRSDIINVRHGTEKVPLRFGGAMQFSALIVKYKVGEKTKKLCINPLPFGENIIKIMNILNGRQASDDTDVDFSP
ncbi:hypothetical protein M2447_001227 [Ereboglobus sp. PH5-10]|uniref:hypothetical protein n=1 Tax=Ereboglobus sp. PH5-10 TaxID=2940629 RepID=UPI002404A8EC|nr:hypothetical protein [Ereboglobus sp. PH5-10]MDF9827138.1 hypothetical protein [Ereboglobus sp. PH5-10]